jgi:hypothetical protein
MDALQDLWRVACLDAIETKEITVHERSLISRTAGPLDKQRYRKRALTRRGRQLASAVANKVIERAQHDGVER